MITITAQALPRTSPSFFDGRVGDTHHRTAIHESLTYQRVRLTVTCDAYRSATALPVRDSNRYGVLFRNSINNSNHNLYHGLVRSNDHNQ